MLYKGLEELRDARKIDERLYQWGKELHEHRNLAAHATDKVFNRQDAEDLFEFNSAICEYLFVLQDRYDQFLRRKLMRDKGASHNGQRTCSYYRSKLSGADQTGREASHQVFPRIFHRQHPQLEYAHRLRPRCRPLPSLVRRAWHDRTAPDAADPRSRLYRAAEPGTVSADVKQPLPCIRMLFDWLVTGQLMPSNSAHAVHGPRHSVIKGATAVISSAEARQLLDSMDSSTLVVLRDRAIVATMAFTFARVSAVIGLKVEDYYAQKKRWWLRLREKNGKLNEMPCHHKLESYIDA